MNPLTKVKLINELNQREAEFGVKDSVSWHSAYKNSAWIFIGGFPYELTEGDLICVFSQYGEIANINLVRDKKTGKSKGFCFICYEDQRSTILAVDNFNGIKIKGRTIRVDHVMNYRPPKDTDDIDDVTRRLREDGCAPTLPPSSSESEEEEYAVVVKKGKKDKKEKKKKKEKKEKKKKAKEERRKEQAQSPPLPVRVKQERPDAGYEKYVQQRAPEDRLPRDGRHEERMYRERQDDGPVRERERERERERDGQAREEEERRKDRGRDGKDGDKTARHSRDGGGRHRDGDRYRREDRHRREERQHREDSERERERSGRQREHSHERERHTS